MGGYARREPARDPRAETGAPLSSSRRRGPGSARAGQNLQSTGASGTGPVGAGGTLGGTGNFVFPPIETSPGVQLKPQKVRRSLGTQEAATRAAALSIAGSGGVGASGSSPKVAGGSRAQQQPLLQP